MSYAVACGFRFIFLAIPQRKEKKGFVGRRGCRGDELTFRDVLAFGRAVPSSESASTRSHFLKQACSQYTGKSQLLTPLE